MEAIEYNRQAAQKFLQLIVDRKIDEAFDTYVDMTGVHHNPFYPTGFPALRQGMLENDAQISSKHLTIKNVLAEGNLVAVHVRLVLPAYEMAVVYLFRFKDRRIVELWDCGMPVPSDSPNLDGVF